MCPLCEEYRRKESTVYESENFFVKPALGKIGIEGYLLICSKKCFLGLGQLPEELFPELEDVKSAIISILSKHYTEPIFFEHGAVGFNKKAGCCIYHAHLHTVPLEFDIFSDVSKELFGRQIEFQKDIRNCFERGREYIYYENQKRQKYIFELQDPIPSQYIRQIIAIKTKSIQKWDWRNYPDLETFRKTVEKLNGWKQETEDTYDKFAKQYEGEKKNYTEYIKEDLDLFLKFLKGKKILDLGSGPGRDSILFKQRGFEPLCIDISKAMVDLCRQKGLKALEMDMESMNFESNSFDGVWAYTSLLHIPKYKIKNVLEKIKEILKTGGIFYLGMKSGIFEGVEKTERYGNCKRYFSLYTKEELEKLLSGFEILNFSKVEISKDHIYLNFLCKKP